MKLTIVVPDHPATLNAALEGLVGVNVEMMLGAIRSGKPLPPLYTSGIRYGEEPRGREWWQTVADNFAELERVQRARVSGKCTKSTTDCEDISGHRAAELRVWGPSWPLSVTAGIMAGIPYPARAICIRTGPTTYHAIVEHPDGRREDPSRALGMGQHKPRPTSPLRRKSKMSNQIPGIYFNAYRGPNRTWRSDIKFNTDSTGNGFTVRGAHMGGWFDAVKHALVKAHQLLNSPMGHKLFVATGGAFGGPAGAAAAEGALRVLDKVATAANRPPAGEQLAQAAKKFTDPSLKQLAKGIAGLAMGRATSMSGGPVCLVDWRNLIETHGANPGPRAGSQMDPWPLASVNGQGDPSRDIRRQMIEAMSPSGSDPSSEMQRQMLAAMMGQAWNPFAAPGFTPPGAHPGHHVHAPHVHPELHHRQQALQLEYQRGLARAQRK